MAKNTLFNAGNKLFSVFLALGLSPFFVHELGLRTFGFWAIVAGFTQYAALLDLGIGAGLTRFIAHLEATDDYSGIDRKASAGLVVTLFVAFLAMLTASAFTEFISTASTAGWPKGWEVCVLGVTASLALLLIASTFQAFPRGLGRWDLQSLPSIAYQITFSGLAVVGLLSGYGIEGLGLASCAGGVACLATAIWAQRKVWRRKVRWFRTSRADVSELVRYSGNLQVGALASVVNTQADKPLILGFGGSLEFVAYYELASRVAFQARALPITALGPLTAHIAASSGSLTAATRATFYQSVLTRVQTLGVAPLIVVYGACYPLAMAWLGIGFQTTSWMVLVLGAGYAINLSTGAGSALANGLGYPQLERNYALILLAVNLILSVVLGILVGPWGPIYGTMLGLSLSSLWFLKKVDIWVGGGSNTATAVSTWRRVGWASVAAAGIVGLVVILDTESRLVLLMIGTAVLLVVGAGMLASFPGVRKKFRDRFRPKQMVQEVQE